MKEGIRGIFRHGFMSFAAVFVTVACLLIVGSFFAVTYNLGLIVDDLNQTNEVLVFVDETLSDAEAKSVGTDINNVENIEKAEFVSREEAMEAYVAKGATAFSDALAKDAFGAAFSLLPASYAGNGAVRQRIHEASTMAGMAFTRAGLGLCHALAHTLGGAFHVPHGRLNAILLPAVLERNSHLCAAKYAALARAAGLGSSADTLAVRNLKNGLIRLRRELGLPATLREAGIDPRQVWYSASALVKDTLADPCCRDNPLSVEDFMVKSILEEVSGRGE